MFKILTMLFFSASFVNSQEKKDLQKKDFFEGCNNFFELKEETQCSLTDPKLIKLLLEMIERSKYIKSTENQSENLKRLFIALGVDDFYTKNNSISIIEDKLNISGTRYFVSQSMKILSKLSLARNINKIEFQYLGAGFATGDVEKYRDLLKKLDLRYDVDG